MKCDCLDFAWSTSSPCCFTVTHRISTMLTEVNRPPSSSFEEVNVPLKATIPEFAKILLAAMKVSVLLISCVLFASISFVRQSEGRRL